MMFSQECVIVSRGEQTVVDRYGKPVWGPSKRRPAPCWYEFLDASEDIAAAEQYTTTIPVFLPLNFESEVRGCDWIEVRGRTFHVIGKPQVQPHGFVVDGYLKVIAQEVTG